MKGGILSFVKDVLFPRFCVQCQQEGSWLCASCVRKIKVEVIKLCPVCARPTANGQTCPDCKAVSALDGITAFFNYDNKDPIAHLIRLLKYSYASSVSEGLPELLSKYLSQSDFLSTELPDKLALVPVPLHPRRQRWRGYNQAEIIAGQLQKIINNKTEVGIRLIKGLRRIRHTQQQTRLSGEDRRKNLQDAFVWKAVQAPPPYVLLVDDVFTTGSTLQECARALKQSGCVWVWGLTLGRG